MMGLGRERHDQVERGIVQIAQGLRIVLRHVDPNLVHDGGGEWVRRPCLHAGGVDVAAASRKVAQDCGPHHRTHRVHGAGEQHRTGELAPLDFVFPARPSLFLWCNAPARQ